MNIVAKNYPIHNNPTALKAIAWLTGLLTLVLAVFAFVLSFNALTDLATQHGVSIPPLFPFVVEFAVVIFSLHALFRSMTGQNAKWQWTLIILSSFLAGAFNIAHAQADILSRAMAAMPSLFLLLSFESFLSLVRFFVTRQGTIVTLADLNAQIEAKQTEADTLTGQIERAETTLQTLKDGIKAGQTAQNARSVKELNEAKQAKIDTRRGEVLARSQAGDTPQQIAAALDVSVRTIRRDIEALNGQVRVTL